MEKFGKMAPNSTFSTQFATSLKISTLNTFSKRETGPIFFFLLHLALFTHVDGP
jgi:hypothetical protein